MKKFFGILFCILLSSTSWAQDPLSSKCHMTDDSQRVAEYCAAWTDTLQESTLIRPATGEEPRLHVDVLVKLNETTEVLGICTTVVFTSVHLGGLQPLILSNIQVLSMDESLPEATDTLLLQIIRLKELWIPFARKAIDNLCPPCEGKRLRLECSRGENETTTDPDYSIDGNVVSDSRGEPPVFGLPAAR